MAWEARSGLKPIIDGSQIDQYYNA